jgi:hypothetical protein
VDRFKEWEAHMSVAEDGQVLVCLYAVDPDGQLTWVGDQEFGPFDTALDVCTWLVRKWSPSARLPMR